LETTDSSNVPSRFNGENIAGAAFLFFSFLFMAAGQVNAVFALVYPVDYMLVAVGVALVLLGYRTWRKELNKARSRTSAHGY
jgi:uncharacterized membrane protein YfcA